MCSPRALSEPLCTPTPPRVCTQKVGLETSELIQGGEGRCRHWARQTQGNTGQPRGCLCSVLRR